MREYGKGSIVRMRVLVGSGLAGLIIGILSAGELKADSWGGSWGGSYGGSRGGWGGSVGNWGSSGGFFGGHRPVRNLLGRIHDRLHAGSGGSYGSYGSGSHGSNGSWGSTGVSYGSYGSHGSAGGSGFASSGGSFGSAGTSYGSMGSSYGSVGSSYGSIGGYGSTGSYGSVGVSYSAVTAAAPVYAGQVIYDSGYAAPQLPIEGAVAPSFSPANVDGLQPVPGVYYEGGIGTPAPSTTPPTAAPSGGNAPVTPPDGSTAIVPSRATVLSLKVPKDAQVFINDHQTRTKGDVRRYVSRNLETGRAYYYHVKATVVRNGKKIERSELVSLQAGQAEVVEFDFEQSVTTLALNVPANAKVRLCGKATNASGASRHFCTTKLEPGQVWNDYTVEVAVESKGRIIRQEKKLNLVSGETYKLDFEFDETNGLLAVR